MSFDTTNLPIGGGFLMAGLAYVGISMFVTGPVVGERTIAKSGWNARCQTALHSELAANQSTPQFTPKIGCETIFGFYGEQGKAFCRRYGGQFKLPFLDQLEQHKLKLHELKRKRLAVAASQTGSRCSCAVSVTLANRTPWAIYAGSIRLVMPPAIKNLNSELMTSLRSTYCTGAKS